AGQAYSVCHSGRHVDLKIFRQHLSSLRLFLLKRRFLTRLRDWLRLLPRLQCSPDCRGRLRGPSRNQAINPNNGRRMIRSIQITFVLLLPSLPATLTIAQMSTISNSNPKKPPISTRIAVLPPSLSIL